MVESTAIGGGRRFCRFFFTVVPRCSILLEPDRGTPSSPPARQVHFHRSAGSATVARFADNDYVTAAVTPDGTLGAPICRKAGRSPRGHEQASGWRHRAGSTPPTMPSRPLPGRRFQIGARTNSPRRARQSGNGHVFVLQCGGAVDAAAVFSWLTSILFDLLSLCRDELIRGCEHAVENGHQFVQQEQLSERCEVGDVRERDRHVSWSSAMTRSSRLRRCACTSSSTAIAASVLRSNDRRARSPFNIRANCGRHERARA